MKEGVDGLLGSSMIAGLREAKSRTSGHRERVKEELLGSLLHSGGVLLSMEA